MAADQELPCAGRLLRGSAQRTAPKGAAEHAQGHGEDEQRRVELRVLEDLRRDREIGILGETHEDRGAREEVQGLGTGTVLDLEGAA